jgi:hypothetical protein
VFTSSFQLSEVHGEARARDQARGREQADGLDGLGHESEGVDRLRVGVQERQAGRGRQRVADEQPAEDGHGAGDCEPARRTQSHGDRESDKQDGGRDEAEPGPCAFGEVVWCERAVDAGADRTGEDEDVPPELAGRHRTITVPSMSCECSVQT